MAGNNYGQVTKGIVIEIGSDSNAGRIKVRIPAYHGPPSKDSLPTEAEKYWTSDSNLPWAEVVYAPGTTNPSTSLFQEGEVVYVMFTSTSYRHPLVIGTTGKFV